MRSAGVKGKCSLDAPELKVIEFEDCHLIAARLLSQMKSKPRLFEEHEGSGTRKGIGCATRH